MITNKITLLRGYSHTRRDCKRIISGSTGFISSISFLSIAFGAVHTSLDPSISPQCRETASLVCFLGHSCVQTGIARFICFRVPMARMVRYANFIYSCSPSQPQPPFFEQNKQYYIFVSGIPFLCSCFCNT